MNSIDLIYSLASSVFITFISAFLFISMGLAVISIIGTWKVYEKAGEPGWASLVPFYNYYVLFKITFGTGWLFLLLFVPCVNVVVFAVAYIKLAQAFGKSTAYGVGLWLLNFVFICMLGFSDAKYLGVPS